MSKTASMKVGNTPVQLPGGGSLVRPTIRQSCVSQYEGFADTDSLFGQPPITHNVDVTISQFAFEMEGEGAWSRLVEAFPREKSGDEEWITIASAQVDEFPTRFYWDLKTTWFDWFDSMDGDLAIIGEFADELIERGDSMALLNGSLLYIRGVDVHPAFSGQHIGARLVAHALWSLSRCDGDVAMLLSKPVESRFRTGEPDCSAAAVRRLTSYYRRMGFERSRPRERFRDDTAVLMHSQVGESRLPFSGLGSLGEDG